MESEVAQAPPDTRQLSRLRPRKATVIYITRYTTPLWKRTSPQRVLGRKRFLYPRFCAPIKVNRRAFTLPPLQLWSSAYPDIPSVGWPSSFRELLHLYILCKFTHMQYYIMVTVVHVILSTTTIVVVDCKLTFLSLTLWHRIIHLDFMRPYLNTLCTMITRFVY